MIKQEEPLGCCLCENLKGRNEKQTDLDPGSEGSYNILQYQMSFSINWILLLYNSSIRVLHHTLT